MIRKIAYRNLWRNKLRSSMVIIAIALGIWGGLLVLGLAQGLIEMRHKNAVSTYVSHVQIHNHDYMQYGLVDQTINPSEAIYKKYTEDDRVAGISARIKAEAFLQSTNGNSALVLNGINPKDEASLTTVHTLLEAGNYFEDYKTSRPIIISRKLAERLDLEIGNKIRLSYSNSLGSTVSDVYKVIDLFRTGNSMYDEVNAFVLQEPLKNSLQIDHPHEIGILLNQEEEVDALSEELKNVYPNLDIETWADVAPELGYADKMMELVMTLFLGIIMAALAFGIINTMLMAVLERKKELGMLLAVGMNKKSVFRMIMIETMVLTLLGAPVGITLSLTTQLILSRTGIDLSFLSKGLESVGLESVIYPSLSITPLIILSVLVVLTGILSAIYPARKALSLNPSETLRTAV